MSIFRSEEHVSAWTTAKNQSVGQLVPLAQVWRLAKSWYTDPRKRSWRPRTRDESQAVIRPGGLAGECGNSRSRKSNNMESPRGERKEKWS
jgi:hypothetical protein